MSQNPLRLQYLFGRYAAGDATPGELEEFWQLMAEMDGTDTVDEQISAWWERYPGDDLSALADPQKMLQTVLATKNAKEPGYVRTYSKKSIWKKPLSVAAALLCLISAGVAIYRAGNGATRPAQAVANKINTGHRVFLLPDGTRVTVNVGTKLQYPPQFADSSRDVYLSGEGYFEVAHDATRPFRVHTGIYTTQVLGTVFDINAYPGNRDMTVTVTRGRVKVSSPGKELAVLAADDRLVIHRSSATVQRARVDAVMEAAWKDDNLVFQDATLGDAMAVLGEKYHIAIRFGNETLKNCRFTGTYTSTDSLDQIIDIITSVAGCSWERTGNAIVLRGGGCAP